MSKGGSERAEGAGACSNFEKFENLEDFEDSKRSDDFESLEDTDDFDDAESSDGLYEHRRVVADKGQNPLRVDRFLIDHLPGTSRNRIQKAAEAGFIQVNGRAVKSNYKVKPCDVVTLMLDRPKRDWEIIPEDIPLDVVYEDQDLLVVNKPAGLVVHPGCGNFSGTLVNALAWYLRDDPRFDANDPTVGLVHRIDKDTSGLLVIAKTPEAKTHLCHQFFVHSTRRQYNALVWGNFQEDEGTIEGNIARNPKDRLQMAVFPPIRWEKGKAASKREQSNLFELPSESRLANGETIGKHAVTHYKVLERLGPVTLVECQLETGRTHQIRVHMKHIGHTLFNDERYGGEQILRGDTSASYRAFIQNCFALCPRQALHARTLGFVHPRTGEEMFFTTDLPADMSALLDKWRKKA